MGTTGNCCKGGPTANYSISGVECGISNPFFRAGFLSRNPSPPLDLPVRLPPEPLRKDIDRRYAGVAHAGLGHVSNLVRNKNTNSTGSIEGARLAFLGWAGSGAKDRLGLENGLRHGVIRWTITHNQSATKGQQPTGSLQLDRESNIARTSTLICTGFTRWGASPWLSISSLHIAFSSPPLYLF